MRYVRRICWEGISCVGVDGRAVAVHFPVGGYWQGLPARSVESGFVEVGRPFGGSRGVVEQPLAVEAHEAFRRGVFAGFGRRGVGIWIECRPRFEASLGEHFGVFPVVDGRAIQRGGQSEAECKALVHDI